MGLCLQILAMFLFHYYDFPVCNSLGLSFSFNVFCDSFFIVDPSLCFIGSLIPSNSLFDIIVDPRWIVDGGSCFWDVSSACIIYSVLENFKSKLGIISDNRLFKGLIIKFSPNCIKICSSEVVASFFRMLYFPFLF